MWSGLGFGVGFVGMGFGVSRVWGLAFAACRVGVVGGLVVAIRMAWGVAFQWSVVLLDGFGPTSVVYRF